MSHSLSLHLRNIQEPLVEELKIFSKDNFDVNNVFNRALELKYTRQIKNIIAAEYESPTDEFISFCIDKIYSGTNQKPPRKSAALKKLFAVPTKRAFHQFVDDCIEHERQKSVIVADDRGNSRFCAARFNPI